MYAGIHSQVVGSSWAYYCILAWQHLVESAQNPASCKRSCRLQSRPRNVWGTTSPCFDSFSKSGDLPHALNDCSNAIVLFTKLQPGWWYLLGWPDQTVCHLWKFVIINAQLSQTLYIVPPHPVNQRSRFWLFIIWLLIILINNNLLSYYLMHVLLNWIVDMLKILDFTYQTPYDNGVATKAERRSWT